MLQCRSVGLSIIFEHVPPEFGARGVRHNFEIFTPSLIFPKICHNFGIFHKYKFCEFSFCISVILNLPHMTTTFLNPL